MRCGRLEVVEHQAEVRGRTFEEFECFECVCVVAASDAEVVDVADGEVVVSDEFATDGIDVAVREMSEGSVI